MSEAYVVEVGATATCVVKGFGPGQKGYGDGTHKGSAAVPREVWIVPRIETTSSLSSGSFCYLGFDDAVDEDHGFPLVPWRYGDGRGRDFHMLKMDLWGGDELWAVLDLATADVGRTIELHVMVLHGAGEPPSS